MADRPLTPSARAPAAIDEHAPAIRGYLHQLLERYDEPVLSEMEALAEERNFPIVGRAAGAFLHVMASTIGAGRIFEFGSGFGYSAYWFAKAVAPGGEIFCTDGSAENVEMAGRFLARAGAMDWVRLYEGWAQERFRAVAGEFDIVYNDVDKGDYPEVWRMASDRIRPGGLYIADNCLWAGRVALTGEVEDVVPGWTEAIREHNAAIAADRRFDIFVNPVRDGLIVARRR